MRPRRRIFAERRERAVEPAAAGGHRADGGGQFAEFSLFEEDAVHALPQEAPGLVVADPCRDHQHPAFPADLSRSREKLRAALLAQIMVEEHQIERLLREHCQRVANARAGLDDQIGIGGEQVGHALANKLVVVDQQGSDRPADWFGHSLNPSIGCSTGNNSTIKQLPGASGS